MPVPLVCFISYNRLGIAASNLDAILKTEDDFELVIVDNGSTDGIWRYIQQLKDKRIKIKHQFKQNYGVVYAINYGLSKREKNQPFIHIENDMRVNDKHWIKKFEQIANAFPEVGLIGAVAKYYLDEKLNQLPRDEETIKQLLRDKNKMKLIYTPETRNNLTIYYNPMIIGCCNYLKPELIEQIGYWNEETCGADMEIGKRINLFTPYFSAITTSFFLELIHTVDCNACKVKKLCKYTHITNCDCFWEYRKIHAHQTFAQDLRSKINEFILAIEKGKRPVYSASIHDSKSIKNNYYDKDAAMRNFKFFADYNEGETH